MTPDGQELKTAVREDAYDAVLKEQRRQKRNGIGDPEKMAVLYKKVAADQSQEEATSRGKYFAKKSKQLV